MDGKELRARRIALGLSMEALARKVGCASHTIWRWETGKTNPNPLTKQAVLRVLANLEAGRRD